MFGNVVIAICKKQPVIGAVGKIRRKENLSSRGATGVLGEILITAPWSSRIIVAGQNLEDDIFFTASAHTKGLNVQFGGSPIASDYSNALAAISKGKIDVSVWQTGHVDLEGAVAAIADSTDTERHTRIAVHPHGLGPSFS